MNDGTTLARVCALIADHVGVATDDIDPNEKLGAEGMGLDSLDRIDLGIALGEHFGMEIPDEHIDKPEMGTAAGIAAYVDQRLATKIVDVSEGGWLPATCELKTGDPRFDPKRAVHINGFRFEPANG